MDGCRIAWSENGERTGVLLCRLEPCTGNPVSVGWIIAVQTAA